MSKNLKIGLIALVIAVAGYFLWRWWKNRQTSIQSPTQSFGTNLNSVAPELVGGSAGPSVGSAPAVSLPINVTVTDPTNSKAEIDSEDAKPQAIPTGRSDKPLHRQRHSAGVVSSPDQSVPTPDESAGERGTGEGEEDNVDEMNASTVDTGTGMY